MSKQTTIDVPDNGFELLDEEAREKATELAEDVKVTAESLAEEDEAYSRKAERIFRYLKRFYSRLYALDAGADRRKPFEAIDAFCSSVCESLNLPTKVHEVARLVAGGRA